MQERSRAFVPRTWSPEYGTKVVTSSSFGHKFGVGGLGQIYRRRLDTAVVFEMAHNAGG